MLTVKLSKIEITIDVAAILRGIAFLLSAVYLL